MNTNLYRAFIVALPALASLAAHATVPGRTPGFHAVSPTGAATYQIPLWVSPGAGGIQPSLTLTYDSQRGSGIVGPGWALNGLSAITRCARTLEQDGAWAGITLSSSDVFCLDGKKLRLTSTGGSGTYGLAGTTYETEIADFTRVTAVGTAGNGPESFIARARNGLTYEFGNTLDSRIKASASHSTPYMWLVNKVTDRAGNSYAVTYGTGAVGSAGVGVPLGISYSRTNASATTYINSVTFDYVAKVAQLPNTIEPASVGYVAGAQVVNTNLLTTINVYSDSNLVHRYSLAYESAPTTTRSRLASVTECANAADCFAPTTISYQSGGVGVSTSAMTPLSGSQFYIGAPDVDGDGHDDLLFFESGSVKVARGTSSGFAAAITVGPAPGGETTFGDLLSNGKDDILIPQSGSWTRYSWNGSGFTSASTGFTVPANLDKVALIDLDGDGRVDFTTIAKTYDSTTRVYTLTIVFHPNLTAAGAGTPSFFPAITNQKVVSCGAPIASTPCDADIMTGREFQSGASSLDTNGNGREELVLRTLIPDLAASQSNGTIRMLERTGSTFVEAGVFAGMLDLASLPGVVGFANWNEDACTDIVLASPSNGVRVSPCTDQAADFIAIGGAPITTMDWNADGRTDVLVQSGANFGVALSTASGVRSIGGTGIPVSTTSGKNVVVFDHDGDGLQDLGTWNTAGILVYRHTSPWQWPDLATSITDAYGVNFSPTYATITNSNYTKGTGAAYPEKDFQSPFYVVSQLSATGGATDGSAASYTQTFSYHTGRIHLTGRGFGGFGRVRMSDSRNDMFRDVYRKTAFPYAGMVYREDVFQPDGTTPVSLTTIDLNATVLEGTAYSDRRFPYADLTTTVVHEVDLNGVAPNNNGAPIKTTTIDPTYDSYGNATTIVTTVTDSFAGSSPAGQQWTSTVSRTISPNLDQWCLGLPTQTVVTNTAPGSLQGTRTTAVDPDYINCRPNWEKIEPGNTQWEVKTNYRYDAFGNVDQVIVTPAADQGQTARTSHISWGATGRHPERLTNPLGQETDIGWNHALGLRTSVTDANELVTSWTYDSFGRMTRVDRPDGTATVFALSACGSSNADCGFSGSRSKVDIELRKTNGNVVRTDTQQFDQFDRPRRTLQQLLGSSYSEITRTYDSLGRLAAESFPHGLSDTVKYAIFSYDLAGRTTRVRRPMSATDPNNHDTTFDYQGLSVEQVDALNRKTKQRRNAVGHVVQVFDAVEFANNYTTDTDYEFDAFGNLLKTRDANGNETVLTYNVRGMKMTSNDPDMGAWEYNYYPLGELKSQKNANLQNVSFAYDDLSRPRYRTENEGVTEWIWGASAPNHNVGALVSISAPGYTETFTFDALARPSNRNIAIGADSYNYDYGYDSTTGQLNALTYPTSTSSYRLALEYVYDRGLLSQIKSGATTYWQANAIGASGQLTQQTLGNGVVTNRQFDAVTGLVSTIQSGLGGGAGLQNEAYLFDEMGNLTQRQRQTVALGLTEDFHYDVLDRLTSSELNEVENLSLTYDAIGNVKSRSDIASGAIWTYHATRKHAVTQAGGYSYSYDANGNAVTRNGYGITWNSANYPTVINGPGKSLTFSYGPDRQRYRQVYVNGGTTETTTYIGGSLEKVEVGGVVDFRHYIHANGAAVAVVSRKNNGVNATRYLLQDHLGSVASILDSTGGLIATESFDAFGKRRDGDDWDGGCNCPTLTQIASITRHGFTGHEMIGGASMGLIHMNGRVMDSVIGRFLSADPLVQSPFNSQSFNRYSYVFNNPLSYTDPSGFVGEGGPSTKPRPGPWAPEFDPTCGSAGVSCQPPSLPLLDDGVPGSPKPVTMLPPGPAVHGSVENTGYSSFMGACTTYFCSPTPGPNDRMGTKEWVVVGAAAGGPLVLAGGAEASLWALANPGTVLAITEGVVMGEATGGGTILVGGATATGVATKEALAARTQLIGALRARAAQLAGFSAKGAPIILDENLAGRGVAEALRAQGYNVRSSVEVLGAGAKDPAIKILAETIGAKVLTADRGRQLGEGFGDLAIRVPGQVGQDLSSIVRLLDEALK